jgi:hypothetical protein
MGLSRREFLAGAAGGALGAAGLYELVDRLATAPARAAAVGALPVEQHVLDGVQVIVDNGIEVLVPPLHHEVITFELQTGTGRDQLLGAQEALEDVLAKLEQAYEPTPAGLGFTVGWGLPYFRRYVSAAADRYLPIDRRASRMKRRRVRVLVPAIRFPSDPNETILEQHDAVVLLRSDRLDAIEAAARALTGLGFWRPTTIRRGFAGGGFSGGRSLPKQMALAAGVPGAEHIPDRAELFLGFTSSQREGLGPRRIANIETLRYSDGGPGGYFRGGTAMHLSHLREDLEAWYRMSFGERGAKAFEPGPGPNVPEDTLTFAPADRTVGPRQRRPQRRQLPDVSRDRSCGVAAPHDQAPARGPRRRREALQERDGDPAARRLQHARQPVLLERPAGARRDERHAHRRPALRRLQPHERRLPPEPIGDGRRVPRRDEAPLPTSRVRPGHQRRPPHDAPPELPRPAQAASGVSAGRAASLREVMNEAAWSNAGSYADAFQ